MAQMAQLSAMTALSAQLIPGFAEVPAHIQDAIVRISLQASQSVMSGTNLARAVEDGREEFEEMKKNHQAMRELLGKQVVIRGVAKKPELNAQVGVAKEVSKEDPKRLVVELANKKGSRSRWTTCDSRKRLTCCHPRGCESCAFGRFGRSRLDQRRAQARRRRHWRHE